MTDDRHDPVPDVAVVHEPVRHVQVRVNDKTACNSIPFGATPVCPCRMSQKPT